MLVAVALNVLWLLVRGKVWRTLLQDQPPFKPVFFTINEGYLLNNILPFRLGEIARAFLLSSKTDLGFWQVLSSIFVERILDLAFAVGLLLITISFVVGASWALEAAVVSGAIVMIGILVLYLMARNQDWVLTQYERLAKRWSIVLKIGSDRVASFLSGLAALNDARLFLRAVAWVAIDWGIAILQYYILMLAFFSHGRFLWAAFTLAVAALGIAAPSSPGALGVYELAVVGAMSVFGLDASTALAFAGTAHLINYLVTGTLGIYALTKDGVSLFGLYRQLRAPKKILD